MRSVGVYLIDDHPVVALGLKIAIAAFDHLRLVGTATDPDIGLQRAGELRSDCLVLDLVFAGEVRLALIQRARRLFSRAPLIVFTSLPARLYGREAGDAGADAFLEKDADMSMLVDLIDKLTVAGRVRPPPEPADSPPAKPKTMVIDGVHLSPRETEVAARVARGQLPAQIAADLDISPHTVAVHRENIRRKLNCRDSKQLVARLARLDVAGIRDGLG